MNYLYLINSIGLFFDIIGVGLVFHFGIPSGNQLNKEGLVLQAWNETHPEIISEWKKYNFWSKFGLGLIIVGFISQISVSIYFTFH
jgi:hypothetical protein